MNRMTAAAWRGLLAGVLFLGVTFGVAFCTVTLLSGGDATGPRAAFEAHIVALDEGRVDDANALVGISCEKVLPADVDAAREGLADAGLTFQTAFHVAEVWVNEDGTAAILGLETPPGLPKVAEMMKVDGEWLVSCG